MKNIRITLILFVLIIGKSEAQEFYLSCGMGLNYKTIEKLNDYLHYNWNFNNRRDDSHSEIEFYALVGSNLTPNFSIETSFGFSLNSFSNNYGIGNYQFEYVFYYPEANFLYDLKFPFYGFQFGFGAGYILGAVNETQPGSLQKLTEETKGLSFQIKSVVYTALSHQLYVDLGLNYRMAFLNDLSMYNFLINRQPYEQLNLSFNSFGIKLGVRYQL